MTDTQDADVIAMSASQRRLWVLQQLDSEGTTLNLQIVFRLRGRLDVAALEQSISDLIARHESLRTTFRLDDSGEPVQLIWPHSPHRLAYVDLLAQAGPGAPEQARKLAEQQWRQPYDIEHGPLIRTVLLRIGPDEHHLALDVHHLIADGWSTGILYREIWALYEARAAGQDASVLPEPPVQYGDFTLWEASEESSQAVEAGIEFWRQRLEAAPAPAAFPADHAKPADRRASGKVSTCVIGPSLVADLRALAAASGASMFMTLLTLFDIMLLRYSGEEDLIVGSAAPGRVHPDVEGLIGCFVNPLVLRTDLSAQPTFREALSRVRETVLSAYENQHVSFDRLVQELRPGRGDATPAFFRTLMQFLEIGVRSTRVAGLDVEMSTFSTEASGIDLALAVVEDGSSLVATWEYDGDLFEAATIERMQRHYLTLAESAVADPDSPVGAMRMLTEDEERQQAPPPAAAPRAPAVHRVVESWAAAEPAATALVSGTTQLTYGELNTRANQVARALRAQGAGPESVVGVMLPRGLDLPVILLAVLKAGACYLPLDPAYPRERLSFMIEDSGAGLVISDEPGLPARTLPLAQLHASADLLSGENLTGGDLTAACAYIIYTSGSTGKPKGVQVPGAGLANLAQAQCRQFGLSAADRVGQFFSVSFDASVFEITMAWAAGAALVVAGPDQVLPGGELAWTFHEQAVTAVTMTPTALTALGAADIPSLRIVSAAGEACPPAALRPWRPQARCFNLYGPTEATIWSTAEEASDADADAMSLPIGRPIPGVSAYVLDASMNPVPSMVTGELYLGGAGVARGYAGRAALTAERFLPDPFAGEPGARMYRSGDMARRRADGRIEFVGRADDQVKIRGYRIELGEVEAVMGGSPLVRQCAAVADDGRLVCHVVLKEASDAAAAERLRAYMADRLPGHLVPDQVVVRDSLPTLPSGKADRNALCESGASARLDAESYVAPRTPMEEFLAGLWAEVLNVPRVGLNDDFFAMGGHSLAATLVATRLKADLRLDVPVTLLFEHQDLGAYTQAVLDHAGKTDSEFAATS